MRGRHPISDTKLYLSMGWFIEKGTGSFPGNDNFFIIDFKEHRIHINYVSTTATIIYETLTFLKYKHYPYLNNLAFDNTRLLC